MALDEDRLQDLIGRLYDAALLPGQWPSALERLSDGLSGAAMHFGLFVILGTGAWPIGGRRHIWELSFPPKSLVLSILPQAFLPAGLPTPTVTIGDGRVVLTTQAVGSPAACPSCGRPSGRTHSRYERRLADLPWQGRQVEVRVHVRRLRCVDHTCQQRIFAERLPQIVAGRVRSTNRLRDIQHAIVMALGGSPGARLAQRLALPVSATTLLRVARSAVVPAHDPPRIIGIDDWAWRRGTRYGTIVRNLERNRVIDLLPDREAETVADWLRRNPGIEVVARDRASAYADGIRRGAPTALQVADRWHLLRNLGDALQAAVERHRKAVRQAALQVARCVHNVMALAAADRPASAEEQRRTARRQQRQETYTTLVRLRRQGLTFEQIASAIGLSKPSIHRWLQAGGPPQHHKPVQGQPSLSKSCLVLLEQRWAEGCRNASRLWRDVRQAGLKASERTVRRWAQIRRRGLRSTRTEPAAAWPVPSKRRCARLLTAHDAEPAPNEHAFVLHLGAVAPRLVEAASLARQFGTMVKDRAAGKLDAWLAAARGTELALFAQGLERDHAAVQAALAERWSTSPVEGQINKLKALKRQMFGRAKLDLLRARLLAA